MDVLYYSNHCKYSTTVLQHIIKNNLLNDLNCICIDKRKRNENTGVITITMDNGKQAVIPPNVSSVPSLLSVKRKYALISGDTNVIEYINSVFLKGTGNSDIERPSAINDIAEPTGILLKPVSQFSNVLSEQYATYSNNADKNINTVHYASLDDMYNNMHIKTPEDTYKPNKLSEKVTIDTIQKQRNLEMPEIPKSI